MADIDLIHAGLPWNNPLKITVKADLYISLLVINRGLLNLLSNDYYLDLKTLRINQYIVLLLGPHIADTTIHWTEDGIIDIIKRFLNGELGNYLDSFGLLKDTAFIIPVDPKEEFPKNVNRIQNIINNCPKNLNGHTAIFALTPVVSGNYRDDDETTEDIDETISYNHTIGDYYLNNLSAITDPNYETQPIAASGCYGDTTDLKIDYKSIMMNSFYGGTIILMGNDFFVCKENEGSSLNTRLTRILLEQIQKDIDKPTSSLITIRGNGENNTRSVVSFNNCNCDSYIWNLGITLDSSIESDLQTNNDTPKKQLLAFFFPANLIDDMITGNNRYLVADSINDLNFNLTYLTLRSKDHAISGGLTEYWEKNSDDTYKTISAINLSGDYLMLSSSYGQFIQTFFGQYISDNEFLTDSLYEGATFCFWMKLNFYNKNIIEVPIIYSVDSNGDGFYFGLDKVANINHNEIDVTQYLDTTFASKKRTDLNSEENIAWNFWSIQIQPVDSRNIKSNTYLVNISYYNPIRKQLIPILPSKTANSGVVINNTSVIKNQITFSHLNFSYPISFFGTQDIRSEAWIRNILLFNSVLSEKEIEALAQQNIINSYNLSEIDISLTFKNGMKGALYVYNTTSMNVLGCNLKKL